MEMKKVMNFFQYGLLSILIVLTVTADAKFIIKKSTPSSPKTRSVTFINDITKKDQSYSYFGISYCPTEFKVLVNAECLEPGAQKAIPLSGDSVIIRYEYSFLSGRFRGAKEITFKLDTTKDRELITFSWRNPWRLALSDAKPLKVKEIYKQWRW